MGKACVGSGLWLSSSVATFFFERNKIPSSHFMTPFEFHGVGSMIRFCFLDIEETSQESINNLPNVFISFTN